jgi:hypothetical protein
MKIREADIGDKERWDSFVESEDGDFYSYFDWKYFYETRGDRYIPLMIETESSQLLGIFPLVKEKRFLYSILESLPEGGGDFLIKNDLSESEKYEVIRELVKYIDSHYAKGCAGLFIKERLTYFDKRYNVPLGARTDRGLKYFYNETTGFPCTHIVEIKTPFEENHWNMWSRQLKQHIRKAVSKGVTIVHDRELAHIDQFIVMLGKNYERHGNKRFIDDETRLRIQMFKDKTKLYIALLDGQPVAGLLCHYTPSTCHLAKIGSHTRDNSGAEKLCIKVAIEEACSDKYKYADLGMSTDDNTAFYKGQFKPIRIPLGTYEKRYSTIRYCFYLVSVLSETLRSDKMYLWHNRNNIMRKVFSRTLKKNDHASEGQIQKNPLIVNKG